MLFYPDLIVCLDAEIKKQTKLLHANSPKEMYEPMSYITDLGGKRIRPLLTLVACDLFDVNVTEAIPSALAVEFFHNFSLIHDDILDKAPLRRGQKTVHEKWNTNIAILSGDGMMVKGFEILSNSNVNHISELLKLYTKTGLQVCEGQQLDMNFETQSQVSVSEYIQMINYKTAVLLACSLQMGAICANANKEAQQHIYEFGKHIGIAFQILDDVLDVYATDKKFGKQIGGDIISNKKTFLLLTAFELANTKQLINLNSLLNNISISDSEKVKKITALYNELNVKLIAEEEANKHTEIALKHLQELQTNEVKKESLKRFALSLLNREV